MNADLFGKAQPPAPQRPGQQCGNCIHWLPDDPRLRSAERVEAGEKGECCAGDRGLRRGGTDWCSWWEHH